MENLPLVSDHPAHTRPLPVDYLVCQKRQDEPMQVPAQYISDIAPKARASAAVFKDTGSEWVPDSYGRTPWAVIRLKHREVLMDGWFARNTTIATYPEVSAGTNKSFLSTGSTNAYNANTATQVLRWGISNTAATNSDFRLNTESDNFNASVTYDLPNFTTTFSGSKVYTGAPVTLNEVGMSTVMRDNASTDQTMLIDHAVITSLAVATNKTVALEYVWTF